MFERINTVIVVVLCTVGYVFAQGSEPAKPTPNIMLNKLTILEPTQGRPRIIKPDESFYFMFRVEKFNMTKVNVMLSNSLCPSEKLQLIEVSPPVAMQMHHWVMLLKAPTLTKPGVYDLLIDLGIGYQRVPRAVKIVNNFKTKFRFVHLSNMNIGEPTAPEFDNTLVDEINLLNPEFIIATGDFIANARTGSGHKSWTRIKHFLAKFQAPCYILCGDCDNESSFATEINPSLTGTINYGPYHFFLMMDTSFHPIEQDKLQIKALLEDLKMSKSSLMTFLVGNRDQLGILKGLRSLGKNPADVLKEGHLRVLLCSGSTDWDFSEYAERLRKADLANVAYVRTGQSSTCMKNGGDGISRYRVFEVNQTKLDYIYNENGGKPARQYSIPTGKLKIFNHGANDGSSATEQISVVNALNQSFANCRLIFHIRGTNPNSVVVHNARLVRALQISPDELTVITNVDIPEKSAVRVLATSDPLSAKKYRKIPVVFKLSGPKNITFKPARTPTGLKYLASKQVLELAVKNPTDMKVNISLQASLEGQALILGRPILSETPLPTSTIVKSGDTSGQNIELLPGKTVRMTITPAVRNISQGKHYIQIYSLNDPLKRLTVFPVDVVIGNNTNPE